jgi:hypothetical protein
VNVARCVALEKIANVRRESIDPARLGRQVVEHYSLPAYDERCEPARVPAETIRSAKLLVPQPAVLLSRLNPHIPRVWAVTPRPGVPALTSTEMMVLEPRDGMDFDYLHALLSSQAVTAALVRLVGGTSTSHQRVRPREVMAMEVSVAPSATQRRVGRIAALLRARTEAARQLEDSLLRYFRSLYRGPGDSGHVVTLGSLASVSKGVSYSSEELGREGAALVTLKSFGRDGGYRADGLKPWWGDFDARHRVEPGDLVVAQTDLTQAADVLGRAVLVRAPCTPVPLVASLDVAVVRPRDPQDHALVFCALLQDAFRAHCRANSSGTTVLHLKTRSMDDYPIHVPPPRERKLLASRASAAIEKWVGLDLERKRTENSWKALLADEFGG